MAQQIKKKFLSPEVINYFDDQIEAVEQSVVAEQSARELADQELDAKILAEESARISGDNALDSRITTLEGQVGEDLQAAITSLQNAISEEATIRQATDEGLNFTIQQEILNREAAQADLQSQINALDGNFATDQELTTAIDGLRSYVDTGLLGISDSANNYTDTVATQLSNTINEISSKAFFIDGTKGMEGDIVMGDVSGTMYKITALADGSQPNDAVNKGQLDSVESGLQSQIDTEKGRIDAILSLSDADKDSFKEIVDLINSVDTENDQVFGAFATSTNAEISAIKGRLDVVEPKVQTLEGEMDAAEGRLSALEAKDLNLEARLVKEEDRSKFLTASFYNDSAIVYADGAPGSEDSAALTRDGWYFQNKVAGQKINWYFYDGTQQAVTLGNFSAYAVMTFDSVAAPIIGVYTAPTGTNDVIPGFAHSRVAYSNMSITPVVGKKYLVYFGQNPEIHPELPRIQLAKSTGASIGEQLPSEIVFTCSFGSNSNAAVNTVKFMVESVGVNSPSFKSLIELKIKHVSKSEYDAKIAELEGVDAGLDARIQVLEAKGFSKGSTVVGTELGFIDLDKEYAHLLSVSVGRLAVHEGEDFTVSVVGGKTRLTWIGSLMNPGGAEKIESGDKVFWVGAF